ncbi:MAG: hypothetical protein JWM47_1878 [Acidimicrobiales bacterium]|nr:hypothetical protein [Acidimicrobiales bacterium]
MTDLGKETTVRLLGVALVLALLASGCTDSDGGRAGDGGGGPKGTSVPSAELPEAETAGLVPVAEWRARQDDYLAFATGEDLDPTSPLSVLAHAAVAEREGKEADLSAATPETFAPIFEKLEAFEDTGDFDLNRLITLHLRHRDLLDPDLAAAIEERILAFKYWWTEPTPEGVVDSQYYWTENHQIIFLADEYIAGQTYRDETFTNASMTGAEHLAHAEERLRTWFEWRSRFGFSEWLSNVYWNEDLMGVLLLAEFAEDPAMARVASMTLDVMVVELAGHVQEGTFGTTHGRSYQKDKLNGRDEDTFSVAKMVFDQTPVDYANADTATLLAVAERYRPPEVARRIAASRTPAVFRTKSSVPIDPNAPVDADAEAPYGLSYEGEEGIMAWWGLGAQFPWQMAPTSAALVKQYDLFETSNFRQAAGLAPVVENTDDAGLRTLAASLAKQVNPGLLSQVDTYTWRSPGVMLSTAQDWRPGQRGEQDHVWQATLDPDTLVFTNHPRDDVPTAEDPNANEGYWTGDGAIPRSAQHENVSISIYAPQYDGSGGVGTGAYSFTYGDHTHAFFPTEHFDDLVERDGWVIGRKGDGYVALWSARPTTWRTYTSGEFTRGLQERFDLVAEGGPDNVWITEVANASDYEGADDPFDAFVDAITASVPAVDAAYCPPNAKCVVRAPGQGATVRYRSPSQGEITFGWTPGDADEPLPPLTVDGDEQDLHPQGVRWDAPYATAGFDLGVYHAELDGATLDLDFRAGRRRTALG